MDRIRTLIVDDEKPARRRLAELLSREPEIEVAGEARDGREAVDLVRAHAPDLMFLDIQMPDLDGFGVLAALEPEQQPVTVFVTAYDRYAIQAFEAHAARLPAEAVQRSALRGGAAARLPVHAVARRRRGAPAASARCSTTAPAADAARRLPRAARAEERRPGHVHRRRGRRLDRGVAASTSACTSGRARTSIGRASRTCCSASIRKRFVRVHRSTGGQHRAHPRAAAAQPRRLHGGPEERHRAGHEPRLPPAVRALAPAAALSRAGHVALQQPGLVRLSAPCPTREQNSARGAAARCRLRPLNPIGAGRRQGGAQTCSRRRLQPESAAGRRRLVRASACAADAVPLRAKCGGRAFRCGSSCAAGRSRSRRCSCSALVLGGVAPARGAGDRRQPSPARSPTRRTRRCPASP